MIENTDSVLVPVSRVAAAYVKAHQLPLEEVPQAIACIYQAFIALENTPHTALNKPKEPAVPIEESVHDDYLICLEDGKKVQILKRHLRTVYGMTLTHYKERWGLPHDYPVVAPSYARRRSTIAKQAGLGKAGRKGRGRPQGVAA